MEKGYADTVRDERTRLSVGLCQVRILSDINTELSDLQMSKMRSNGADRKRGRVMTYTEKELDQFLHGISLSLLSKKSAQHWRYDE